MTLAKPSPQQLLQLAQKLSASAQILAQLNELLQDVNSGLEEIARLLKRDTPLAVRIIRISNSVAYGSAGGIASVEDAVNRVGFAEVYRLTGLAAATHLADHDLPLYGLPAAKLRDNTLLVALAMDSLAKATGVDARVAYTAGLMRPAGKLILDLYGKTLAVTPQESFPRHVHLGTLLDWENNLFGCTNAAVAAQVMTAWRFPVEITEPVRQHYLLQPAAGPHQRVALLLNLACGIAQDLGRGLPGEPTFWKNDPDTLRLAGVTDAQVRQASDEAHLALEALRDSLD